MTRSDTMSRRAWRRLEKRAVRAHERALLASLRELAADAAPLHRISARGNGLRAIEVVLPDRSLVLTGVSPRAGARITELAASGPGIGLTDAGRYGPYWWISVGDADRSTTVLAAGLRVSGSGGGSGSVVPDGSTSPSARSILAM